MAIDRANPTPLYHQLERELLARIKQNEWGPGDLIPTESEICAAYDLSRTTVRQALANLVHQGVIVRRAGKGSFVRESRIMSDPRGILQGGMEAAGLTPRRKVLSFQVTRAELGEADDLALVDNAPLLKVTRLLLGDTTPIALTTILMPRDLVPNLTAADFEELDTYEVLAREGIRLAWGSVTVEARLPDEDEAAILEVPPGSPVLTTRRLTHLANGRPFEILRWVGRANMVSFSAHFDSLDHIRTDLTNDGSQQTQPEGAAQD